MTTPKLSKETQKELKRIRTETDAVIRKKKISQSLVFSLMLLIMAIVTVIVVFIFGHIIVKGVGSMSFRFMFGSGDDTVMKAMVGTLFVTIITAVFAIPIGVCTAIYLNEYARQNKLNRMIRLAIRTLSGVPSVVYGLFGLIIFIRVAHLPTSVLASGLTLGLMTLPWIITSSEEALRSIPIGYREGSLALGASKWYTIRKNVLPYAISGILTGGIIGLARAAGETAPILFTGAASRAPFPTLMGDFEALAYKIYYFAVVDPQQFRFRGVVYATSLVLLILVLTLMIAAIIIRYRLRKKYKVL
jgi:phosphate transport system permease protein